MTGSTVDYSTDIMWDLFPDESVKTTQIQPTVKNVQLILLKYTQWNQLTKEKKKKKVCRDLTPLCIPKQRLNRQTRALVIKVRSFCQRPNIALCFKEIFFIFICIFFQYIEQVFFLSDYIYPQCIWLHILLLHVSDLFNFSCVFFSFSDK